jgi:hypothetical protein
MRNLVFNKKEKKVMKVEVRLFGKRKRTNEWKSGMRRVMWGWVESKVIIYTHEYNETHYFV